MALIIRTTEAFLDTRQNSRFRNRPHDNYGPRLNVIIWILTGISSVFLALRLYCKRIRRNKLWWDDWILIASFIVLLTQTSLLSVCIHFGLGRHSYDIKDWLDYLYYANITGVCSIIAAAWSKTSFAVTLLRLSTGWSRKLVWFTIGSVNLFLGLSCIFTYVQCNPVSKLWDSRVKGVCWNKNIVIDYNSFSSAWSGFMDILLAILPWYLINRLSLNKKERVGVLVGMSIGSLAGVTSIAKTATLNAIKSSDTIYTVNLMILATAETAITIVAACIPVLRVLIKNTMQSTRDHSASRKSKLLRNASGFELLKSPASPVGSEEISKKTEFTVEVEVTDVSTKSDEWRPTVPSKAALNPKYKDEDSWLSPASQSRVEVQRKGS